MEEMVSKGLIIGGLFLAAKVMLSKKSITTVGCCGKDDKNCEANLICLRNDGDCPSEVVA